MVSSTSLVHIEHNWYTKSGESDPDFIIKVILVILLQMQKISEPKYVHTIL